MHKPCIKIRNLVYHIYKQPFLWFVDIYFTTYLHMIY